MLDVDEEKGKSSSIQHNSKSSLEQKRLHLFMQWMFEHVSRALAVAVCPIICAVWYLVKPSVVSTRESLRQFHCFQMVRSCVTIVSSHVNKMFNGKHHAQSSFDAISYIICSWIAFGNIEAMQ